MHYIVTKEGHLRRTTTPAIWSGCTELTKKEWLTKRREDAITYLRTILANVQTLYAIRQGATVKLLTVHDNHIQDITFDASFVLDIEPKFGAEEHVIRRRNLGSSIAKDTWELVYTYCKLDNMPAVHVL